MLGYYLKCQFEYKLQGEQPVVNWILIVIFLLALVCTSN